MNYETTWYASNKAAYDEVEQGRLGEIRRVVVHDGHQGPKEIGVPPEFLSWLTDPATEWRRRALRLRLLWRGPDDVADARRDAADGDGGGESRQAADLSEGRRRLDHHPARIRMRRPCIMGSWNWPFARKDMEVYGATGYAITVAADQIADSASSMMLRSK